MAYAPRSAVHIAERGSFVAQSGYIGMTTPLAVIACDARGHVLRLNRAADMASGFPMEELIGRPVWESLVPRRCEAEVRRALGVRETFGVDGIVDRRGIERRARWHFSHVVEGSDGIAWLAVALPALDASEPAPGTVESARHDAPAESSPDAVAVLTRDLTVLRQAQQELLRSERRFRILIEHAPDAIAVMGARSGIKYANSMLLSLLGRELSEVIGMRPDLLIAPSHRELMEGRGRQVFKPETRALTPQAYDVLRADGTRIPIEIVSVIIDDADEPLVVSIGRDIRERLRLEAQLHSAERLSALGTLAAGVAHEINNPLAYIMTNLEHVKASLRKLESPEPLRAAVAEALEGARRVASIVMGLRAFSRADHETIGPVDVARAVRSAVDLVSNEVRHRAALSIELPPLPAVHASEPRLVQCLVNLLMNAGQAIPPGNAERNRVTVRGGHDTAARSVVIEIIDTGSGIVASDVPRIFDPFFTTKPLGEGTGLGLAIVRGIVTALGGDVSVDSTPGVGSTFRLTLVVSQASVEDSPVAPLPGPLQARSTILIVDDEEAVTRSLVRGLGERHDVRAALTVARALEMLRAGEHFDLILCDLMMPQLTGMDFYDIVAREFPALLERIVFMTGGALGTEACAFIERPNVNVRRKPMTLDELELIVERMSR